MEKIENIAIVFGFYDRTTLVDIIESHDKVFVTDQVLSFYYEDLKLLDCSVVYERISDNLFEDNQRFKYIYKRLFRDKSDNLKFILGPWVVELMRLEKFFRKYANGKSFIVYANPSYKWILSKLDFYIPIEYKSRSNKLAYIINLYRFIIFHKKISFYGKYNYIYYSLGLVYKYVFCANYRNSDILEINIGGNNYVSTESFFNVSWVSFIKSVFSSIKPGFNNRRYNLPLEFVINKFLNPYLKCVEENVISNFNIINKPLYQNSDMSPHRYTVVETLRSLGIKSIIGQHGEIIEPLCISDFISDEAVLISRDTFILYKLANPSKPISLIENTKKSYPKKLSSKVINKTGAFYIFTSGCSGMTFDFPLKINLNLIQEVVHLVRSYDVPVDVVVKLHPSESIDLYKLKGDFPSWVSFSKKSYEEEKENIFSAVISPSTLYPVMLEDNMNVYLYQKFLTPRHISIKEYIRYFDELETN